MKTFPAIIAAMTVLAIAVASGKKNHPKFPSTMHIISSVLKSLFSLGDQTIDGANPPSRPAPEYDYLCADKSNGNYLHPFDCTQFLMCSNGLAHEFNCGDCNENDNPGRCRNGRLVFDKDLGFCNWADLTPCQTDGGGTTETELVPPVTDPTTGPRPPQEGDPCDPELCRNNGYCQDYLRCDKETGKLVKEHCGENLVWNPLHPNGTVHVHGGNCDIWENLSPEVEHEYRSDKDCLACFWRGLGECRQDYDYQPPDQRHRNVLRLSCSDGLVFSEKMETCQRCEDVQRADGSSCCGSEEGTTTSEL